MVNIHVNPENGDSGQCHAKVKCRFGGENVVAVHFSNPEEAAAFSEKVLSEKHGMVSTLKRKSSKRGNDNNSYMNHYNSLKDSIPAPKYSQSELADYVEEIDGQQQHIDLNNRVFNENIDKALEHFAIPGSKSRDLIKKHVGNTTSYSSGLEEYIAETNIRNDLYFKDKFDNVEDVVDDIEQVSNASLHKEDRDFEAGVLNYPLKAKIMGTEINPVYSKNLKDAWDDSDNPYGRKATEELLRRSEEQVKKFEETGDIDRWDRTDWETSSSVSDNKNTKEHEEEAIEKISSYMFYKEDIEKAKRDLGTDGLTSVGLVYYASKKTEQELSDKFAIPTKEDTKEAEDHINGEKKHYMFNFSDNEKMSREDAYKVASVSEKLHARMYKEDFVPAGDKMTHSINESYSYTSPAIKKESENLIVESVAYGISDAKQNKLDGLMESYKDRGRSDHKTVSLALYGDFETKSMNLFEKKVLENIRQGKIRK